MSSFAKVNVTAQTTTLPPLFDYNISNASVATMTGKVKGNHISCECICNRAWFQVLFPSWFFGAQHRVNRTGVHMSPEQIEWRWKSDSNNKSFFSTCNQVRWMDDWFSEKTRCVLLQFPVDTNLTWLQSKGSSIFFCCKEERRTRQTCTGTGVLFETVMLACFLLPLSLRMVWCWEAGKLERSINKRQPLLLVVRL